jgi:microcystin-dependent protein
MAFPTFVRRSYAGGASPATLQSNIVDNDLSIALTGNLVLWPTGGLGPFTIVVDNGLPSVEKILCSAFDPATQIVSVWTDGVSTGRGYDGTTAVGHTVNSSIPQVQICWTATEASEANLAVTYMLGDAGSGGSSPPSTGQVLTWNSGAPAWIDPGGGTSGLLPIGTVIDFAGPSASVPTGFLVCDGTAVSRTTYAALFTATGNGAYWGSGDGSTTFNLPNLQNRFAIGAGSSTNVNPGHTGGSTSISTGNMPSHNHTINIADSGHFHAAQPGFDVVVQTTSTDNLQTGGTGTPVASNVGNPNTDTKTANISASSDTTGSGSAYFQPYATVIKIIRAL